jgi:ribose transport system ATP-binding protein
VGVGIVHQELSLVPHLTVAENLTLGREPRRSFGRLDRRAAVAEAEGILERLGAGFAATRKVASLSTGEQQLVEIGRALGEQPRVLILDEPTAALSVREATSLLAIVRSLRDSGIALLYITHRMEEIEALADRVTVLRDGRLVETLDREQATPDAIVRRMVGRSVESLYEHGHREPGEVRLRVRGLTDGTIGPADIEVRAGEIVGVAGLIGAGRSELARMVFGAQPSTAGEVAVDGEVRRISSPSDAMRAGIALVPESRKDQGLFLHLSVRDNIGMSTLRRTSRAGVLDRAGLRDTARAHVDRLGIRVASIDQPVGELSGGNQQKVLLAKWLETDPAVLILDEPTRGVDIGAKAEIYHLMDDVASRGVAVLFISSELPEVLGMSDRAYVMREGRIVADLARGELTEEGVMRHATGIGGGSAQAGDATNDNTEMASR